MTKTSRILISTSVGAAIAVAAVTLSWWLYLGLPIYWLGLFIGWRAAQGEA